MPPALHAIQAIHYARAHTISPISGASFKVYFREKFTARPGRCEPEHQNKPRPENCQQK
jgi:hypothetical protein